VIAGVLLILACSAAASFTLTPLVRAVARQRGWLDCPDGERKIHRLPVPRLGGVAVFAGFAAGALLVLALEPVAGVDGRGLLHLLGAALLVLGVGVADDVAGARPAIKLAVQSTAALYLFFNGYGIHSLSNPVDGQPFPLGALALPLTLLWFVGVSNAFNLIDGLDGLASGVGLFSTTTLFVAAVLNQQWETALLATALGGALLGFLRYNTSPASIFLGDSGALFVGFVLAGLAVRGHMKSSTAIAVAAPLLALALPLLDAGITVLRRLLGGQGVFQADVDHIHHRLVRQGLAPNRVVVLLYAVAAFFGAASLLTISSRSQVIGLVVIAMSVATWLGLAQLRAPGARPGAPAEEPSGFQRATSLASLWNELARTAAECGFVRVELFTSEAARPLLEAAARGAGLPPGFPAWRRETSGQGPVVSWRVPLVSGGQHLGTLVLARGVHDDGQAGILAAAIERDFADRWHALLRGSGVAPNGAIPERLGDLPAR
jgi:UDP-GlcNAc:undecaprenyl-phosphate GlcNAc-1-phosphate transferase